MAYSQSKKNTDLEKRLQLINDQLYGKQPKLHHYSNPADPTKQTNNPASFLSPSAQTADKHELAYLKEDMTKIAFLTAGAIILQMAIFLLSSRGLFTL
ncbi:MAG: hypothetical protein M1607_02655 [Patescibacteria group bacterium]|nr:hypothetical protein [Patescibacteria group bacterium]